VSVEFSHLAQTLNAYAGVQARAMSEAVEGLLASCEGILMQSRVEKAPTAADCTAQVT
jgi:hypothetical protein